MVESTMDIASWLRKQLEEASPDLLRAMVQGFAEALMGAEADALCGASYGERSSARVNVRSGYRERGWDTRVGTKTVEPIVVEPGARTVRVELGIPGAFARGLNESGWLAEEVLAAGMLRQGKPYLLFGLVTGLALIDVARRRSKTLPRQFVLALTAERVVAFGLSAVSEGDDTGTPSRSRSSAASAAPGRTGWCVCSTGRRASRRGVGRSSSWSRPVPGRLGWRRQQRRADRASQPLKRRGTTGAASSGPFVLRRSRTVARLGIGRRTCGRKTMIRDFD